MKFKVKLLSAFLCTAIIFGTSADEISADNDVSYQTSNIQVSKVSAKKKLSYDTFSLSDVPAYDGKNPYAVINNNVQPDIWIDYSDGSSKYVGKKIRQNLAVKSETETTQTAITPTTAQIVNTQNKTYILNTNTKKFHIPSCSSVILIQL